MRKIGEPTGRGAGRSRIRRGSILVLVIGTMALMGTLAVLYTSLGASDRRSSRAVVQRDQVDQVPLQVRRYVGGVLARDVLSVFPSPAGVDASGNQTYGLRRETWDYPWTDPVMQSQPSASERQTRRFRPEGSYPVWPSGDFTLQESMQGSDPWLASDDPEDLAANDLPLQGNRPWTTRRDWRQMSNFAPDGRAVNLYNLRNNFDAEPGFGTDSDGLDRLSENLSVYDQSGIPTGINGAPLTGFSPGASGDENIPAHLFTNQRFAVRAVQDDAEGLGWGDRFFPRYQYADADGDGMNDSRWVELVDATDPNRVESVVEVPEGLRVFFAFKAVDLSARVNVNTATDFTDEPEAEFRAGLTPADVDLRRLLSLEDIETVRDTSSIEPIFDLYDLLDQPRDQGGNVITNPNDPRFAENYQAYAFDLGTTPEPRTGAGDRAYDYLRYTIERGIIPPSFVFAEDTANDLLTDFDQDNYVSQGVAKPTFYNATPGEWEPTAEGRSVLFAEAGAGGLGASFDSDSRSYENSFSFGIGSLLELLTFNGVNDPSTLSPLEAAVGGRLAASSNPDDLFRRFDPLRSNRSLAIERDDRDGFDTIQGNTSPDGRTDLESYLHLLVDVRHRLTTISGARQLRSTLVERNPDALSDEQIRARIGTLGSAGSESKFSFDSVLDSPNAAFALYADAMAPLSGLADQAAVDAAWDEADPNWPRLRTLFYGYRGADAAVRMAAHMAVNLADLADGETDTAPTGRTLGLERDFEATFGTAPWFFSSPLNLGNQSLPLAGTNPSPAVNVYGIEPQPFITEVASVFISTDATIAAGGDDETNQRGVPGDGFPGGGGGFVEPLVTIDPDMEQGNEDFLMAAIAVQLANPFDVPLTGDLSSYFIELRTTSGTSLYYALTDTDGKTLTLGRDDTATFVILSESLGAVDARFQAVDSDGVLTDGAFAGQLLDEQLSVASGDQDGPFLLGAASTDKAAPGIDPLAGFRAEFADGSAFDINEVRLWRQTGADPAQNLMADRLRLPAGATLDASLDLVTGNSPDGLDRLGVGAGQHLVEDARAFRETVIADDNFNQGLTIVTWASVKRPDDPAGTARPRQAFPAWALEGRWSTSSVIQNSSSTDSFTPSSTLEDSDFPTSSAPDQHSGGERFRTIAAFANRMTDSPVSSDLVTVDVDPDEKSANPIGNNAQGISLGALRVEMYPSLGEDSGGMAEPERAGVAGLLLPLAVGSEYDPVADEWITLGESLALALNFSNPPDISDTFGHYAPLSSSPETALGGLTPGGPDAVQSASGAGSPSPIDPTLPIGRGAVDRAHLVLDDFVPYLDTDTPASPGTAPNRFDPATETVFGLGITPAMQILGSVDPLSGAFAGRNGVVQGLININTATRPVLRTIPMLAPSRDDWWWSGGTHRELSDATTTLIGYRDQSRRGTLTPRPAPGGALPNPVVFGFSFDIPRFPGAMGVTGRQAATLVPGLRHDTGPDPDPNSMVTAPGVRSIGEMLAARIRNADQGFTLPSVIPALHNIDRLGNDSTGLDRDGVDAVRYDGGAGADDAIEDDYDEQLALVNAALGSTTDRTDYVAVWFVMHGYRESDVTGLGPEDPLVPSIARRYLMVVDRSNVRSHGDEPEILLFEELPM